MPVSFSFPSFGGGPRKRALTRAAKTLRDDAQARTPSDSGELKKSAEIEHLDADSVRVKFTAPHAVRRHYSKKYDDGRLFLLDATESAGPRIAQILADEIRRGLQGR